MTARIGFTTFRALGTSARVVVAEAGRSPAAVQAVREEIDAIDLSCSRFREDSELSRLNATPGRWTVVGPVLFEAVRVALGAARATDGAVDPTVGDAVRRIGYDRDLAEVDPVGPAVDVLAAPGWRVIGIDPERSAVLVPEGASLDLGATAKALAADRAAARAADVAGCGVMVSLGGDLAAFGEPPAGGWTVSIADDHAGPAGFDETIAITGGGLATSSTTVRRWVRGGKPVHHVVDPRTGGPAAEVWRTVSVAARRCVDANTATTAAIVLGEVAAAWLGSLGLPARLVRRDGRVVRLSGWPAAEAA